MAFAIARFFPLSDGESFRKFVLKVVCDEIEEVG